MVDFRPTGPRREGAPEAGKAVELLVVEYEGSSGTAPDGSPVHWLDVQALMAPGFNEHLARQANPHLHGSAMRPGGDGNPLVAYASDDMLDIVAAAWQLDSLDSDKTGSELSDVTEQNVVDGQGRIIGSAYVVQADVVVPGPGQPPRIASGSIRRVDPDKVPANVMDAQRQACRQAAAAKPAKEHGAADMPTAQVSEMEIG